MANSWTIPNRSLPFLLLTLLALSPSNARLQLLDPDLKFSEIVDQLPIAQHFENLAAYHPFYTELGNGTLPTEKFMGMIQQDDLYVRNFFKVFEQLAEREQDPELKTQLSIYASDNWDSYFKIFYDKFDFAPAVQMVPSTLAYSGSQIKAAVQEQIAVALATTYPCYTVWAKIGAHVAEIADLDNNPNHPYKEFIEMSQDYTKLPEFTDFIDGYFQRLGNESSVKKRMIMAYIQSVEHEYKFAENNYRSGLESIPPPQFSDLVDLISPELQEEVIFHPLYIELAEGILLLEKYESLIQQDHIYLRGFYKAYEIMEAKETNPEFKTVLHKDPTARYKWMEEQYDIYGFGPADRPKMFTSEYMDHLIARADCGNVAEGLAAVYPCYLLWNKMGEQMANIANASGIQNHPYRMFVEVNDPSNSTSLARMNTVINGYFTRLGDDIQGKLKMFEAFRKSVNHEFLFANGVFEFS